MYKILYALIYWVFRPQTAMNKIEGLENLPKKEGFILAANHQNSHDPLIMIVALKKFFFRYVWAKKKKMYFIGSLDLKRQWLRYSFISLIFGLFEERVGYLTADKKGLKKALAKLQKENIVVIFPEGRRNITSILKPGKKGAAVLALLSGKKIIPVGCFGPAIFWLGQITGFFKKKWIKFGKPFCFPKADQKKIDQEPEILKQATAEVMGKISLVCGKSRYESTNL